MNENELNTALAELAAQRIDSPDLRSVVRAEIARRKQAVNGGKSPMGIPPFQALFPVSIAAAVLIGIAIRFGGTVPKMENPQADAAKVLHLDMFNPSFNVSPTAILFTTEP